MYRSLTGDTVSSQDRPAPHGGRGDRPATPGATGRRRHRQDPGRIKVVQGMATLKDVATAAGVSLSTAGAALRGESIVKPATRDLVLQAARRLGYSTNLQARYLKRGRTDAIAVLIPHVLHPYYARLVHAIDVEAAAHGLRTIIQQTGYTTNSEELALHRISAIPCDGLILNTGSNDDEYLRTTLGNRPVVLLNYPNDPPRFDNVAAPVETAINTAFGYLSGRGYRHVAVIGGQRDGQFDTDARSQRLSAHHAMRALSATGLGDDTDFIHCAWNLGGGFEAARLLCEPQTDGMRPLDRYDAFYCMNDMIAYGLIRGLHDHGIIVPDDKAVFGNDGAQSPDYMIPSLTTVAADYDDIARKAVAMLIERIANPDLERAPMRQQASCHLVIGESA